MHTSKHRPSPAATVDSQGFTLIELLTVIAIIGILAAIIIPTVGAVRATALNARAAANLRSCFTMHALYANDNKDKIAPYQLNGEVLTPFRWTHLLVRDGYAGTARSITLVDKNEVFGNPAMIRYYQSKGYDLQTTNTWARNGNIGPDPDGKTAGRVVTFSGLEQPSRTLFITEGTIQSNNRWFHNEVWSSTWLNRIPPPADFQKGKAFVLFADGHTLLMPGPGLKDLWDNDQLFSQGAQ
ncbi:hypothetical protein OPIT5_15915 [Opitutaceae bacterium TAV5]|nr:hypothetical protein OPIT5_15915 [Opitutaceae bacterium TAV5]